MSIYYGTPYTYYIRWWTDGTNTKMSIVSPGTSWVLGRGRLRNSSPCPED